MTLCFVGGVGSGKSTLARWLGEKCDLPVVDGDRLGHIALKQPEVMSQLVEHFGSGILDPEGEIDRSKLGLRVWGDDSQSVQNRKELERIVHPVIRQAMQEAIEQARQTGKRGIIIDAAVILEAGGHGACDRMIFGETPEEKRLAHVVESRNWTEQQFRKRENSQLDLDTKRKHAHFVVDNSGSIEQSGRQLMQWLHQQSEWSLGET